MAGTTGKTIIQIASCLNVNLSSFMLPGLALPYGRASDTDSRYSADERHHSLKHFLNWLARRIDHNSILSRDQRRINARRITAVAFGDVNECLLVSSRRIMFTLFGQSSFR
ncbi:MAG: hypothetical protein QOH70_4263, partial [Blastocatellia bacterium]|nr:hypothetical protein [Blastocatellia bacterium]